MKKLVRILPVFALILGITAAFATQEEAPVEASKKALNSANVWIDITGQVQGTHYACDAAERICTQLFDEMGNQIPDTEVEGRYRPLNP